MPADRVVFDGDTCRADESVPPDGLHGPDGNLITLYPATPPPSGGVPK